MNIATSALPLCTLTRQSCFISVCLNMARSGGSRWVLAAFGLLHSISTSGVLFCWPSIYLMLKRDHHYTSLCSGEDGDTHDNCVRADLHSAKIYTVSLALQSVLALPLGLLLDCTGPRLVIFIVRVCHHACTIVYVNLRGG